MEKKKTGCSFKYQISQFKDKVMTSTEDGWTHFSHCVCVWWYLSLSVSAGGCAYQIPAATWVHSRAFIILIGLFLPVSLCCARSKTKILTKDRHLQWQTSGLFPWCTVHVWLDTDCSATIHNQTIRLSWEYQIDVSICGTTCLPEIPAWISKRCET